MTIRSFLSALAAVLVFLAGCTFLAIYHRDIGAPWLLVGLGGLSWACMAALAAVSKRWQKRSESTQVEAS